MEWYQAVEVASRQSRMSPRDSFADPHRILATQDDVLDLVIEMSFRSFRGEYVGRTLGACDNALQLASFSRNHGDKGARESPGVREGHAVATIDLSRDPMLESADEGLDVARRRHGFTRRTSSRRRGVA